MNKLLNNQIEEPLCSLEVCRLLKEKGFMPENWKGKVFIDGQPQDYFAHWQGNTSEFLCRPTQALALDWLLINFELHLHVYYLPDGNRWGWGWYKYKSENGLVNEPSSSWGSDYQEKQEAIEGALHFILTLITYYITDL